VNTTSCTSRAYINRRIVRREQFIFAMVGGGKGEVRMTKLLMAGITRTTAFVDNSEQRSKSCSTSSFLLLDSPAKVPFLFFAGLCVLQNGLVKYCPTSHSAKEVCRASTIKEKGSIWGTDYIQTFLKGSVKVFLSAVSEHTSSEIFRVCRTFRTSN
jgi:hypothetical protein